MWPKNSEKPLYLFGRSTEKAAHLKEFLQSLQQPIRLWGRLFSLIQALLGPLQRGGFELPRPEKYLVTE